MNEHKSCKHRAKLAELIQVSFRLFALKIFPIKKLSTQSSLMIPDKQLSDQTGKLSNQSIVSGCGPCIGGILSAATVSPLTRRMARSLSYVSSVGNCRTSSAIASEKSKVVMAASFLLEIESTGRFREESLICMQSLRRPCCARAKPL